MKKLLLFILLFCITQSNNAQTNVYHPFPDSSAFWNEEAHWSNGTTNIYNPEIEFFGGDTTISAVHYKKIIANGYEYGPSICCNYTNKYLGALREDTLQKKVFFHPIASTASETVIYDFSLHVGDTLAPSYISQANNYVSSIDSILIGASYRKKFNISLLPVNSSSSYVALIEGVGSTFGLLAQLTPSFEDGTTLNCFSQNNVTLYPAGTDSCSSTVAIQKIYGNQSNITIYPNPAQNNFTIEPNNTEKQTLQVFDVSCKLVLTQTIMGTTNIDAGMLAQGVYNVNITGSNGVINKRLVVVR
jgi:hypothetical protein